MFRFFCSSLSHSSRPWPGLRLRLCDGCLFMVCTTLCTLSSTRGKWVAVDARRCTPHKCDVDHNELVKRDGKKNGMEWNGTDIRIVRISMGYHSNSKLSTNGINGKVYLRHRNWQMSGLLTFRRHNDGTIWTGRVRVLLIQTKILFDYNLLFYDKQTTLIYSIVVGWRWWCKGRARRATGPTQSVSREYWWNSNDKCVGGFGNAWNLLDLCICKQIYLYVCWW